MQLISLPSTAFKALTNVLNANQDKNVVLDPFTTIVRLSLLSALPTGTKIGIYDHQITYYTPGDMQGVYRFFRGDKRSDLHNLFQPIKKAVDWYSRDNEKIRYIFDMAHDGLVKLKDNYHSSNTNSDNSTYITLSVFDNILTGKQDNMYESITPERAELIKKEREISADNAIHTSLRKMWSEHDVSAVYELLNKVSAEDDTTSRDELVEVIKKYLETKDNLVKKIIEKNVRSL
jgi:hypothetical protein